MKNLFYSLALLCIPLLFPAKAFSQISGFQGKRFMVFTDLTTPIMERGYTVGLEFVRSRRSTIVLTYSNWGREKNVLDPFDPTIINPLSYRFERLELTLKKYYNKVVPAPKGFFRRMAFRTAKGYLTFTDEKQRSDPNSNSTFSGLNTYSLDNVRRHEISWGYGYTHILPQGFYLEGSLSLVNWFFDYQGFFDFISDYETNVGANTFNGVNLGQDWFFGLHTKVKIGYLF